MNGKQKGWRCLPCERKRGRDWKRQRDPIEKLWTTARDRARQLGADFSISVQDVARAWPVDGLCPILGLPMRGGKGRTHDGSPTLDRLNNDWGYTPENIAVISYAANRAKGNLTAAELEKIVLWMRSKGFN